MDTPREIVEERATVIGVDPSRNAYRVHTSSGRNFTCVRRKAFPSDTAQLEMQTQVVVSYALGAPYICGILPDEYAESRLDNPANVTDTDGHGGEDPTFQRNLRIGGRAPGAPQDLMPGDSVQQTEDGAAVGVLRGKAAILRGSPLAQIRALGQENLVQLVSGLFQHYSWMGKSEILNENGKTSYRFRGGSDQLMETGPDAEKYTIHLDVGHTGDLLDLRITTLEGDQLFRFHVTSEGGLDIYARGGIRQMGAGQSHPHQFVGTHQTEIQGDHGLEVAGQHTERLGSRQFEISDDDHVLIGQDRSLNIGRNLETTVGGNVRQDAAGETQVLSTGNMIIISREEELRVFSKTGMRFATQENVLSLEAPTCTVKTPNGDSINLGDGATSHAVLYEQLRDELNRWVEDYSAFKRASADHTHAVTGSLANPSVSLTTYAASSVFNLDLSAARSRWVRLK